MKPKFDLRVIGAWIFVSFLIFLFGSVHWKLGFLTALSLALLFGLRIIFKLSESDVSKKNIVSRASSDGVVTAEIEEITTDSSSLVGKKFRQYYHAYVKRNYPEGAYFHEKEFDAPEEALTWVEKVYQQELEQHLLKLEALKTALPAENSD